MKEVLLNKTILFVKKYKYFIAAIILVPFVLYAFAISAQFLTHSSKNQNSNKQKAMPTPHEGIEQDEKKLGWSPNTFTNNDLKGIISQQTRLADGSIQYAYPSDTTGRQKIIIVKNGNIIYQRTPVYDTSVNDYLAYYGTPQYFAEGSYFWGRNEKTFIYLTQGIAFVVDTNTNKVLEQMNFQPTDINTFKKNYGSDLIGNIHPYQP